MLFMNMVKKTAFTELHLGYKSLKDKHLFN